MATNNFTAKFDKYSCPGDSIVCDKNGVTIAATIVRDDDSSIDDDDCHNADQSVTGCDESQQERLLAARKAWQNDEWFYCGIVLSISIDGTPIDDHAASLWGIECNYPDSDNSYLTEVANELLPEALESVLPQLELLAAQVSAALDALRESVSA